jgi:hypothetical protein
MSGSLTARVAGASYLLPIPGQRPETATATVNATSVIAPPTAAA